ncbi:hypothetical protein BC832DRAFT_540011 [Gaertneriomyces semiglobifer]|nr:hypothetical protein BC832DRAFT_540011 [Gaertneriomyces semiglobifer]
MFGLTTLLLLLFGTHFCCLALNKDGFNFPSSIGRGESGHANRGNRKNLSVEASNQGRSIAYARKREATPLKGDQASVFCLSTSQSTDDSGEEKATHAEDVFAGHEFTAKQLDRAFDTILPSGEALEERVAILTTGDTESETHVLALCPSPFMGFDWRALPQELHESLVTTVRQCWVSAANSAGFRSRRVPFVSDVAKRRVLRGPGQSARDRGLEQRYLPKHTG